MKSPLCIDICKIFRLLSSGGYQLINNILIIIMKLTMLLRLTQSSNIYQHRDSCFGKEICKRLYFMVVNDVYCIRLDLIS